MRLSIAAALVLLAGSVQAQTPLTGTTAPIGSPTAPRPTLPAPTGGAVAPVQSPATPRPTATPTPATPARPVTAPATPATTATPATPPHHGHTLQEQFDAANVTHDGHLTQEQARAKMPSVARDFADIDTTHKGYVTVDEIRDHRRAVRAAHRAAKKAAAAKQ